MSKKKQKIKFSKGLAEKDVGSRSGKMTKLTQNMTPSPHHQYTFVAKTAHVVLAFVLFPLLHSTAQMTKIASLAIPVTSTYPRTF